MSRLDFQDTKVAFSRLSDRELDRAYMVFKLLSVQPVVQFGPHLASAALRWRLPVARLIKASFFSQFCGGESIDECKALVTKLSKSQVYSILDYASEGFSEEADFDKTLEETLQSIAFAARHRDSVPFCVFKPTGICSLELMTKASSGKALDAKEEESLELARRRFRRLCKAASKASVRLFVDAEESWIQPYVDELILEMMALYNKERAIVFTTAQMYRTDRLSYLKNLHKQAEKKGFIIGVKLVRGAYLEKETHRAKELSIENPVFSRKEDTDHSFDSGLRFIMSHLEQFEICAGTHNEKSSLLMARLIEKNNLQRSDNRCHFAQLLGMSDHITYNLAAAGFRACKYVPYGPLREVLPYLARRAHENSSVRGQTSRELSLLGAERARRRG